MKVIKEIGWYELDGKVVLMVGGGYHGSPLIMCQYDVLVCSRDTYLRFKGDLIAEHLTKRGWKPVVRFI